MKWKTVIFLLCLSGTFFVSVVQYYGFSWNDLRNLTFYENLANPYVKIVKVQEGLRKEEVADVVAQKLNWNDKQKDNFINFHLTLNTTDLEGHYFPKSYFIPKDEEPSGVLATMMQEYNKELKTVNKPKTSNVINSQTALIIASIIQRESGGKSDMKLISGIIWNRLFKGMKLQMDATLQYAKGEEGDWWPTVEPEDKQINSPYNTYLHSSLPPTPIANPGISAISAAYNPQKTSCLFYLHDKKGNIHCSSTYQGHLNNIDKYY